MKACIALLVVAAAGLCSGIMKPDENRDRIDECGLTCSRTMLHHAVEMADVKRIKELLKGGKNMYATDCNGLTPMHYAITSSSNRTTELILAFINNEFDVYKNFGEHSEVLFYAIRNGTYEAVETLLQYGAPYKMENEDFLTPLQVAIQCNREDVARLLMKQGANILTEGKKYIERAIIDGNVEEIKMIIALGFNKADLANLAYLEKAIDHDRPSMVTFLIKYTWWTTCYNSWNPLIERAKTGNKKAALNAMMKSLKGYGCIKQLSPEKWEAIPHPNATGNAV